MKYTLTLFSAVVILVLFSCNAASQESQPKDGRRAMAGIEYSALDSLQIWSGKILVDFRLVRDLRMHYSFGLGYALPSAFYWHLHGGAAAAVVLQLVKGDRFPELMNVLSVLAMIVPEGLSYDLHLTNRNTLNPYLNFLGVDGFGLVKSAQLTGSAGIRSNLYGKGRRGYSPHAGLKWYYGEENPGFELGMSVIF